jgi:hypothetical protein
MSFISDVRPARRLMTGLCLSGFVAVLSGCGSNASTTPENVVTVTVTPTITAKAAAPTATVATTTRGTAKSDVVGRNFDLGTIVAVEKENGVPVLILDRWTARDVSSSTVAAQGVPMRVHSDRPYENQNTKITYRIPVSQGAVFTYRHCVALDQPAEKKTSTLAGFQHLQDPEKVILVSLDTKGQVVEAQNDPAC